MIDLHTHILPNLDDGAGDLEDAVLMAELSAESGVTAIVCTPHCNIPGRGGDFDRELYFKKYNQLRDEINSRHIPVTLFIGMEIYASDDVAEKILDGRLLSINSSRYCLIEFGFFKDPIWMTGILNSVADAGKVPLVAHPERYACVQDDPRTAADWIKRGFLLQVNKGSFFGRFGPEAEDAAVRLLEEGLITCVASDAHSPYHRTTHMGDIREYLENMDSVETADLLLQINPKKIITDQPL